MLTTGSMLENRAHLAPSFVEYVLKKYSGTRLERQEIHGELLLDVESAIVTREMIETARVDEAPDMVRCVVAVDPYGGGGDACGIGAAGKGVDGRGYVLEDRTCKLGPEGWGRRVIETALDVEAECIVVETNYGGDMCVAVINAAARSMGVRVRIKTVTASRGKHLRFEPVGAMYERGEVSHVGDFPQLEDEIVLFTPNGYEGDKSPNRADWLTFALTELFPVQDQVSWGDLYGRTKGAA